MPGKRNGGWGEAALPRDSHLADAKRQAMETLTKPKTEGEKRRAIFLNENNNELKKYGIDLEGLLFWNKPTEGFGIGELFDLIDQGIKRNDESGYGPAVLRQEWAKDLVKDVRFYLATGFEVALSECKSFVYKNQSSQGFEETFFKALLAAVNFGSREVFFTSEECKERRISPDATEEVSRRIFGDCMENLKRRF